MGFIIFLVILLTILIISLFTLVLNIKLVLDFYRTNLKMTLIGLHSHLKAFVTFENNRPMLSLYLWNKRLFKRRLRRKEGNLKGLDYLRISNPKDMHVNAFYGFKDPFTTGITCGAINMATQFINIDYINHTPDFNTPDDYIYLDASAKIKLGPALINLFRARRNS